MAQLLEKAFVEAAKLPEQEQDIIAEWLMEELASDARWDKTFSESTDLLAILAEEAMAEFRSGKTQPLDSDLVPAFYSPGPSDEKCRG